MKLARLPDGSPEIFYTLQGEGLSLGSPAIFIRLSLCNLHCHWCDTPYTWNWQNTPWEHQDQTKFSKEKQILELTPSEIAPLIQKHPCDRLIITGGEPLLQQDDIPTLLNHLPAIKFIEIETNGTRTPSPELQNLPIQYNVSPKLSNSQIPESKRIHPDSIQFFTQHPDSFFKFVICDKKDMSELEALRSKFDIPASKIFLMPQGTDAETLQKNSLFLAPICQQQGYRLSPRLHVLLWGNQRAT